MSDSDLANKIVFICFSENPLKIDSPQLAKQRQNVKNFDFF